MSEAILRSDTIFHPVGQGGFTTGSVSLSREPRHLRWPELPSVKDQFFWAFDCGTASHQKGLEAEIDLLAQRLGGRELGLLAISHFDNDHVSGLVYLLKRIKVDILLLPYAPLRERVFSVFNARGAATADAFALAIDPVGFLTDRARGQVNRIILVPQSGEEDDGAAGATTLPIGPRPDTGVPESLLPKDVKAVEARGVADSREYPENSGPRGKAPVLEMLPLKCSLSALAIWEFLPYNRKKWLERAKKQKLKSSEKTKAEKFYDEIDQRRSALMNASDREKALKALKELYEKTFGKGSEPKNRISLALSSAPMLQNYRHNEYMMRLFRSFDLRKRSTYRHERIYWREIGADTLLCGDGYLTEDAYPEFSSHFDWRGKRPLSFQVPHHGSRKNYHPELAEEVCPEFSIFCAEPTHGPMNHPDFIVHRSFEGHAPVIVDGEVGAHFCTFRRLA